MSSYESCDDMRYVRSHRSGPWAVGSGSGRGSGGGGDRSRGSGGRGVWGGWWWWIDAGVYSMRVLWW